MTFVYLHVIWFACWIGFGVERYPYGLLTMIVSLEAIFLSTFVMISQNRADAKRQVLADQQWRTVQEEDHQNRQLLELSEQILDLTKAVHAYASGHPARPRRIARAQRRGTPVVATRRQAGVRFALGALTTVAGLGAALAVLAPSTTATVCLLAAWPRPPRSRPSVRPALRVLRVRSRSAARIGPLIPSRRRALAQLRRELDRLPETRHPRDGDTASRG